MCVPYRSRGSGGAGRSGRTLRPGGAGSAGGPGRAGGPGGTGDGDQVVIRRGAGGPGGVVAVGLVEGPIVVDHGAPGVEGARSEGCHVVEPGTGRSGGTRGTGGPHGAGSPGGTGGSGGAGEAAGAHRSGGTGGAGTAHGPHGTGGPGDVADIGTGIAVAGVAAAVAAAAVAAVLAAAVSVAVHREKTPPCSHRWRRGAPRHAAARPPAPEEGLRVCSHSMRRRGNGALGEGGQKSPGLRRRRPGRKNAKKPLTTIEQNGKIKCLCLQKMGTLHPTLIGSIAVSHRKGNRNLR